jgi:response regulator NasT
LTETLTPPRILTVDDDPIVRADLRVILEDAGFSVVPDARDGDEAVERAREHAPDLIVLDLGLPGLDGFDAASRILSERDVPIVALTGHSEPEILQRAADAETRSRGSPTSSSTISS